LELQQLLEGPLLGPEGDAWKNLPREMSDEYERWIDAQIYSEKASELYANYKDIVYPLEKTKRRAVLENMWKYVNLVSIRCAFRRNFIHLRYPQELSSCFRREYRHPVAVG
jgi:hypothetical protein